MRSYPLYSLWETPAKMAKKKAQVKLRSHGIYRGWDAKAKELPRIAEFTLRVPAVIDIEFGFVINVKGGKNKELFIASTIREFWTAMATDEIPLTERSM